MKKIQYSLIAEKILLANTISQTSSNTIPIKKVIGVEIAV